MLQQGGAAAAEQLLALVRSVALESGSDPALVATLGLQHELQSQFGIDSLGRMELLTRIERELGEQVPESAAIQAVTPLDLLRAFQVSHEPAFDLFQPTPEPPAQDMQLVREPAAATTLIEALLWHGVRTPERVHIHLYEEQNSSREITYGELLAEVRRIAAALTAEDVKPGDRVALVLPTSRHFFSAFFAVQFVGAAPVPLYPPFGMSGFEEHAARQNRILTDASARLVLTTEEHGLLHLVRAAAPYGITVRAVEQFAEAAPLREPVALSPQATALIQYTSGSTGNPKGVVLSHANLLANIRAMQRAAQATTSDVTVSWLPLYHDMGLIGAWLGSCYVGYKTVILSPQSFIVRPQRWLEAISRHRGTISAAPNFAYEICASRIPEERTAKLDLSSWRLALNGAEPVHPETIQRFTERYRAQGFRPESMYPVYGLAECSVGLCFPPPGRGPRFDRINRQLLEREGRAEPLESGDGADMVTMVGCGFPLPGHQVRIVDNRGRELPERRVGMIQFSGPSTTDGYFGNAEATASLRHGEWLQSGDLGYIAEGEIFLTGRVKDLIIKGGRNIYPQELEYEIGELPSIRKGSVAAFGIVDRAQGTEEIIVCAETREKDEQRVVELRRMIQERCSLALGIQCDRIVLVPPRTLPKTSSGKIRRSQARERFLSGELNQKQTSAEDKLLLFWRIALGRLRAWCHDAGEQLYAVYCYCVFVLLFAIAWPAVVVVPGSLGQRRNRARWICRTLLGAARLPVTVNGVERLKELSGPLVIASNHCSYLDCAVLTALLPPRCSFVAKRELATHALAGPFLRALGAQFVERVNQQIGLADHASIEKAVEQGDIVVFFPEGTFTREPGLRLFRLGAFTIAAQANCPVLPIALHGTRSVLRDVQFFPRRRPIEVTILPPELPSGSGWSAACELRDRVRTAILPFSKEGSRTGTSEAC